MIIFSLFHRVGEFAEERTENKAVNDADLVQVLNAHEVGVMESRGYYFLKSRGDPVLDRPAIADFIGFLTTKSERNSEVGQHRKTDLLKNDLIVLPDLSARCTASWLRKPGIAIP